MRSPSTLRRQAEPSKKLSFVALLSMATALGGCALPLVQPEPFDRLDPQFSQSCTAPCSLALEAPSQSIAAFWREFQDPTLNRLVDQALAANTEIKLAQARLREARAQAGWVQAETWPQLGTSTGIARTDVSGPEPAKTELSLGATFNWEIDFGGRSQAARTSAAASVSASEAGISAAQRLISAEVASNYLSVRTLQQRWRIAQAAVANQSQMLRIVEVREALGRGTLLDVSRARALVDTTKATLPALEAAIERASHRLATLSDQTPHTVKALWVGEHALPQLPMTELAALPVGTPQRLLERRPDLVAAWQQVQAAHANITLARSDLFPRINLSGALGFMSQRIGEWGDADSRNHSAGAFLNWTPFDFGRIRARINVSEARAEQVWLSYAQTVQLAVEETEGALALYTGWVQQAQRLSDANQNASEAARLAQVRFEAGAGDFLSTLDAHRSLLQAQDALAQSQGATLTALVAVYRALGGGWGE